HGGRRMIFASSSDRGKTDALVNLTDDLTAFVRQAVQEGSELDAVERGVFARLLHMGRVAIELFLDGQGDGDLGTSVTTASGSVLHRSATVQERPLRTIFGEHAVRAYVYALGSQKKIALRPIDARLNLPTGKASYLLQ